MVPLCLLVLLVPALSLPAPDPKNIHIHLYGIKVAGAAKHGANGGRSVARKDESDFSDVSHNRFGFGNGLGMGMGNGFGFGMQQPYGYGGGSNNVLGGGTNIVGGAQDCSGGGGSFNQNNVGKKK